MLGSGCNGVAGALHHQPIPGSEHWAILLSVRTVAGAAIIRGAIRVERAGGDVGARGGPMRISVIAIWATVGLVALAGQSGAQQNQSGFTPQQLDEMSKQRQEQ